MKINISRYLPDFAGIFCLSTFVISLIKITDDLLRDGDTFWHIKAGTVMLENQSLIDSDIFSHTAFGTPWTAHEWLSEIIMASIHKIAGIEGIFCFFLLISSLSFWLLFKITEKKAGQLVTFSCVAMALLFSATHVAPRPHLFTWLFMLITFAALNSGGKYLYWLPPVTIMWANLHGGFILGLVLQGIYISGAGMESFFVRKISFRETFKLQRRATIVLLISVCAVGLNPFGYDLLLFPFHVSKGVFSQLIGEWKPPNLQTMWYFRLYLVGLVLLIATAKSAITWTERLLIIFFLNAALTHTRHISLMLMALTPFIARTINNHFENWPHKSLHHKAKQQLQLSAKSGVIVTIALAVALLVSGSIDHRSLKFMSPKNAFNVKIQDLEQLSDFLKESLPEGNMFNGYALGGYLLYALDPPPQVFIDGRADMYGEKILSDYNKIKSSNLEREKILEQYNVDWIVFKSDSELISSLKKSGKWKTSYINEHYAVLIRAISIKLAEKDPATIIPQ